MKSHEDRRPFCPTRTPPAIVLGVAFHLLAAGALVAQQAKPAGDKPATSKTTPATKAAADKPAAKATATTPTAKKPAAAKEPRP